MSKTIFLKCHKDNSGLNYIEATDVFNYCDENTEYGQKCYQFALIVQDWQNYWNFSTPTAFGNPDYNYLSGQFTGYIMAKEFVEEETDKQIILKKNNKKLWVIDKVQKPQSYYEAENENREVLNTLFS